MEGTFYIIILGLIYVLVSRLLMNKLVDRNKMKEYQDKMKEINERFVKASKNNDVKELERLHEMQKKEIMPEMKNILIEQMKMFAIIMVLFTVALHILPQVDQSNLDDIHLNLSNGTTIIKLDHDGVWWIEAKEGGRTRATLKIAVLKGIKDDRYKEYPLINETGYKGGTLSTNKKRYYVGEKAIISYNGAEKVELEADKGTRPSIYLGLPFFEIIEGEYSVFIVSVVIGGLVFSLIEGLIKKIKKKPEKREEKKDKN